MGMSAAPWAQQTEHTFDQRQRCRGSLALTLLKRSPRSRSRLARGSRGGLRCGGAAADTKTARLFELPAKSDSYCHAMERAPNIRDRLGRSRSYAMGPGRSEAATITPCRCQLRNGQGLAGLEPAALRFGRSVDFTTMSWLVKWWCDHPSHRSYRARNARPSATALKGRSARTAR